MYVYRGCSATRADVGTRGGSKGRGPRVHGPIPTSKKIKLYIVKKQNYKQKKIILLIIIDTCNSVQL